MIERLRPNSNYYQQALQLLRDNNLPTEDINYQTILFGYILEDKVIGTVGLEIYSDQALLRSLAVDQQEINGGIGTALVDFIENHAQKMSVKTLVLLTTTASTYFNRKNYSYIERAEIPEAIKQSAEFTSMCPASATAMIKTL